MRPVFQAPIGLTKRACLLAGIRSYKDARVRSPLRPILASGFRASSSTWYSNPIAEPLVTSDSVTKYFTPLLAPGVILNSNDRSNALYMASVTISPPPDSSFPADGNTCIVPSAYSQPLAGNLASVAPRHPLGECPSYNSFHPLSFSWAESLFGIKFTT